jgi:hypothetical protein
LKEVHLDTSFSRNLPLSLHSCGWLIQRLKEVKSIGDSTRITVFYEPKYLYVIGE